MKQQERRVETVEDYGDSTREAEGHSCSSATEPAVSASQEAIKTSNTPLAVAAVHVYEVRPRRDKHGVDLISDVLPFGRLCYGEPNASAKAILFLLGFRPRDYLN